MMNCQPTLKSDLLEIRPLNKQDHDLLYLAASDPLIWKQHPQPNRYQPDIFRAFFDEALASGGAVVIIDRSTNQIIGTSRFYDESEKNSSIVIGYTFLTRKYWGGLYNRDLKKLMVNYALQSVNSVYFHVGTANIRSQKAMLKIGGVQVGIEEIPVSYAPPKKSFIFKIESPL